MTANHVYNITKNKGHGFHFRKLCQMLGLSITYGFTAVYFEDRRFLYREARPYLEGLCEAKGLPTSDWRI